MKTALFPGSFDPFTVGHKQIVDRTLSALADRVIIAVGINAQKKSMMTVDERLDYIRRTFAGNPRVEVVSYEGLTADLAAQLAADFIVRGVRSVKDYEYEQPLADINRRLTGIETVLLFTDPQYASVSSSVIRELISYGKDVSQFLPLPIE